jgi:cobalt-zinc-cadmium efflux system membrane fusion protein
MAHVGTLVNGRVSEMKAHIGDTVKQGEVLFTIESPELGQAQNAFLKALNANATAWAAVTLAENNATVAEAAAELKVAATQLVIAEKSAVVKQAKADVNATEALLEYAKNSSAVVKAQADLKTATATVALTNNNATVATAQGKLDATQPVLKRAQALYESGKKLAKSGAIAITELKRRESAMMTANAEVMTARAALKQAKAKLARDQQAAIAAEQAATAILAQSRALQTRDIVAARAKIIAANATLTASIAIKEQGIAAAKAGLTAATATLEATNAARKNDLAKAKSTSEAAGANVATARNQLEIFGMDEGEILALQKDRKLAQHYTVLAPRNGTVVEREVTEGENTSPDQPHLLILADLSKVWVLMEISPARAESLKAVREVTLVNPATGYQTPAKLDYISPVVDAQTRTVQARVELDNAQGQWRPGQFLTALLPTGAAAIETLAVPAKAVQYVNGQPTVYMLMTEKENTFEAREVAVGATVNGLLPVTAGLEPDEQIVISGSFLLKAELGKAGAGHDHSH